MKIRDLIEELKEYSPSEIIFVGIGNDDRCDDAAGILFLDMLRFNPKFRTSHFINAGTNPENHLQQIFTARGKIVIFVDAVIDNNISDEVFFLNPEEADNIKISTHSFSLKLVEEFLLAEQKLIFKYLCIKGYNNGFGNNLSPELQRSIEDFFRETIEIK
jgi:hydrogenase 3 maturation protease